MRLLMSVTDARIIQYALTLLDDFVAPDPAARCALLTKPGTSVRRRPARAQAHRLHTRHARRAPHRPRVTTNTCPPPPRQDPKPYVLPFLQLVGTSGSGARISSLDADPYILEHAAMLAAATLAADAGDALATSSLLAWVMTHVKQYGSTVPQQAKVTEVSVAVLAVLMRNDFLRRLFVEEHGVERLVPMVGARSAQLLYEATFCLWSVSLVPDFCPVLERTGAVTAVGRVFRAGMPVKVLRVAAALLVNVARHPACGDSVAEVCETHVPEVVEALLGSDPRLSDPELVSRVCDGGIGVYERSWCRVCAAFEGGRAAVGTGGAARSALSSPSGCALRGPRACVRVSRPPHSPSLARVEPATHPHATLSRSQLDDLRWLADAIKGNKRKLTSMERYEREVSAVGDGGDRGRPARGLLASPDDATTCHAAPPPPPPPPPPPHHHHRHHTTHPHPQLVARRFEWTPVHTPDFWKEHALDFEAGDFRLIKALAGLLADPGTDDTTLAVAVADLGNFAVAHPAGRPLLATLGVRPVVMALLKRGDDEVKQQCLLACSKMLVTQWQFVGGQAGVGGAAASPKEAVGAK